MAIRRTISRLLRSSWCVHQERHVAGCLEGEDPALDAFLAGGLGGGFHGTVRKSGQLRRVAQVQLVVVGLLQVVLAELQGQQAQFLAEGTVAVAGFALEIGTVAHESAVGLLQQCLLFGGEEGAVGMFVHIFDAFEELRVQADVVAVLAQQRHQDFGQAVQLVVGFGTVEVAEDIADN